VHLTPSFLAAVLLREHIPRALPIWIGVALVGCGFLAGADLRLIVTTGHAGPALVGLVSAVLAAGAYTTLRELRRRDHPLDIVFWFNAVTILCCLPFFAGVGGRWFARPSRTALLAMAGAGSAAAVGQILMTWAYRIERASIVAPFIYTTVLFSTLFGWLFWEEAPAPSAWIGGAIVVTAGVAITLHTSGPAGEPGVDSSETTEVAEVSR